MLSVLCTDIVSHLELFLNRHFRLQPAYYIRQKSMYEVRKSIEIYTNM